MKQGSPEMKPADKKVDITALLQMRSEGATQAECAKRFGVHCRVVSRLLLQLNESTKLHLLGICPVCRNSFKKERNSTIHCSRACFTKTRTTPLDKNKISTLYAFGMTQEEIASQFNTTQKVIHKAMKRHGIETRVAAKRNQIGPNNHMWKGKKVGYKAAHDRVYRKRGAPKHCSFCDKNDPEARYYWANLTGQYHDVEDYISLCGKCHVNFDRGRKNGS